MPVPPQRPDLHCHSIVSDGTRSPTWLAQRAHERGVDLWALTDHDEVGGVAEAAAAASTLGLPFLSGVEISVTWQDKTIHIVGLGVDENHSELVEGLRRTRNGRVERGQAMAAQLEKIGIPGVWQGALKYVGNPELVSRSHLARHLVDAGVCRSMGEVFYLYLKEGKPGFVPHQWASLPDALGWIHAAGGMAVVAHPARYDLTPAQEQAFFDDFVALGGQGVEVVTSAHSPAESAHFAALAQQRGLYASCGSDFHCPEENRCELGALPPLPTGLVPVWEPLAARIRKSAPSSAAQPTN
ncbi:MAG: 3',5'-nucleoside bisphosphate phosphatase [Brachymonas sp.]|nr:3',5'-nucleoside bisphosphate phosphatase [Brachymonas sp.]